MYLTILNIKPREEDVNLASIVPIEHGAGLHLLRLSLSTTIGYTKGSFVTTQLSLICFRSSQSVKLHKYPRAITA